MHFPIVDSDDSRIFVEKVYTVGTLALSSGYAVRMCVGKLTLIDIDLGL